MVQGAPPREGPDLQSAGRRAQQLDHGQRRKGEEGQGVEAVVPIGRRRRVRRPEVAHGIELN